MLIEVLQRDIRLKKRFLPLIDLFLKAQKERMLLNRDFYANRKDKNLIERLRCTVFGSYLLRGNRSFRKKTKKGA